MKTISISIHYHTIWGQNLHVLGSIPQLGEWQEEKSIALNCTQNSLWSIELQIAKEVAEIEFKFAVLQNNKIVCKEYGEPHKLTLPDTTCQISCLWQERPLQAYFQTSMFSNTVFHHPIEEVEKKQEIQIIVSCTHISPLQELVISGNNNTLGNWGERLAATLCCIAYGKWQISFNPNDLPSEALYKLAIRDKETKQIVEWEDGENRAFPSTHSPSAITEIEYRKNWIDWKASGVAIPVFSLRSENSYGIGEFSDIPLLVDWAQKSRMHIIQILPINDTTASYSWLDSYPYNAISIYALNPIYLGLREHPLKDKKLNNEYLTKARKLNQLSTVDYTAVILLKTEYLKVLYNEIGTDTLSAVPCQKFYKENAHWLDSYAAFCYFRDKYKTANIQDWGEFAIYNKQKIDNHLLKGKEIETYIAQVIFTQFLLHKQLTQAKEYAYRHGVVLKGDIPIGVSPNSVEVWKEPHLFNLDSQTGAPPDDFAHNGQNWGFPTYNWAEMKKDGYKWWTTRFQKMADYFDAYRIDHILGFFRIWEIPKTAVHGLLGYFSPALPLSLNEIESWGISFDQQQMAVASIHQDNMQALFGEHMAEAKAQFLLQRGESYILRPEFDTQQKIKTAFAAKDDTKSNALRDSLYELCNEVLFVQDKYDSSGFHPRIQLDKTLKYGHLPERTKESLFNLYKHYFYQRHSEYWRNEAMSKLPTLLGATNMLVCGEDLGMVPQSVPSVMKELEILSLEIQRMPKELGIKFGNLATLPYLSVSTTSTHDMSPIRMWWQEDKESTQKYYSNVLEMAGEAPNECTPSICTRIVRKHLQSSAMLSILPLQDWLSIDETVRRKNAEEERINEPSNPQHYWNYRMHITLEQLNDEHLLTDTIRQLNEENGR